MAAKTQNHHSPFSRISRLIRSRPSSPLAREPDADPPPQEDWYIPYSGPYEPPRAMPEGAVERDSWGNLVSGWLAEDPLAKTEDRYARMNRDRAKSDAATLAHAPSTSRNRAFSATRSLPRANVNSIIHLDQAGGVGEAPVPTREAQEALPKHATVRHSLASILSLGTRRGLSVRHSSSAGQLSRKTSASTDHHYPPAQTESTPLPRRHPYAFPYSTSATAPTPPRINTPPPASSPLSPARRRATPQPSRTLPPPPFLEPTPQNRLGIRGSISTPNLRHLPSHSQLRAGAGSAAPPPVPKGKHRWLSPETWCDALILPRPRFAIRVDPGGSSGRIVSPPGSPVLPNTVTYYQSRAVREPTTAQESRARASSLVQPTVVQPPVVQPPVVQPVAGPSHVTVETQQPREVVEVDSSGDRHGTAINIAPTSLKPPRPKSFALDDLALPSPVPSLTKVLEEGRQLEADRKAWQSQATRSFQNKRVRSVSRARAKTLSAAAHAQHPARESAFGVLAERSLLGNQSRPPTVHVRLRPSKSQLQGSSDDGTGAGVGTLTSQSHGRTQSHAHSNSVGTATSSQGRTEESFMWGGSGAGHGRGRHQRSNSLSKNALRLVRHTASSAAGFCGFSSAERVFEGGREKVGTPAEEKAVAFESAMRRQDTRVLRLQDQVRHEGDFGHENVVVVTPPEQGGAQTVVIGAGGLSPAPSSAKSSSGEVGIAISTPTPSDQLARQQYEGRERLRIPAHPYAQGATFPVHPPSSERGRPSTPPSDPQHDDTGRKESLERHRQPVLVHPYAPFSQTSHPYASVPTIWAKPEPHQTPVQPVVHVDAATDEDGQEIEVPADMTSSMYAEITPGHIREIQPEQLRYSPFIMVHPVEQKKRLKADTLGPHVGAHPYGPQSKRTSQWGFADALTETLRGRGSMDSGLGTSESLEHLRDTATTGAPPPQESELPPVPIEDSSERSYLRISRRETARSTSNHTLASSPMEFMNPPSFRTMIGHSCGSSPGVISHDSSPPLSPRSLNANDDLERFRDLFYQPPPRALTPEDGSNSAFRRPVASRQPSSSVSTRSVSGLTTLARQLAEDLEDIRHFSADSMDEIEESPMYGRRVGGLRVPRPEDANTGPNIGLSDGPSLGVGTPPEASSPPLRFSLDETMSLAQPTINVPEDVAESSRASSIFEYSPQDSPDAGRMRVGSIGALTTPAVVSSPRRSSTQLSFVHYLRETRERAEEHGEQDIAAPRVHSGYSSLRPASYNVARASFLTSGTEASRMSGLSDFPVPPTDISPDQLSVLNSYFDHSRYSQQDNGFLSSSRPGAVLVREASTTTFGGQSEIGQAL